MEKIAIKTNREREIIDLTAQVNDVLKKHRLSEGLCHLFLTHTTAALTTTLIDPESELDLTNVIQVALPEFKHQEIQHGLEHTHYVTHVPSHVIASFLGPSLTIPIAAGKLKLGKLQSFVLVELNGPRERQLLINWD